MGAKRESPAKAAGEPPEQMPSQHWLQGWIQLDILQPEMLRNEPFYITFTQATMEIVAAAEYSGDGAVQRLGV
jgi:hypothetical protein